MSLLKMKYKREKINNISNTNTIDSFNDAIVPNSSFSDIITEGYSFDDTNNTSNSTPEFTMASA